MHKEIRILKTTGTKSDEIGFVCAICKDENGKNRTKIFDNIDSLDKHVKATHSNHPSYNAMKLLIRNLRIGLNLGVIVRI